MDGFLWGVATAAYQVEGGLNGPGGPANNWAPWDAAGKVEYCGEAVRFWAEPDELLRRAAAIGCNAFRMSVEWARVETARGVWDGAALDRYAEIIGRSRALGMEPIVTLHHFTHPLWCGLDLWSRPDSPQLLAAYAGRCVRELNERLDRPLRWIVTLNEPAVLPLTTYVLGMFPGGSRGIGPARRAYDHLLAAHVRAYDAVHDAYEEGGWDAPLVATNEISWTAVALDAVIVDLLLARERGVHREDLRTYLRDCAMRARRRVAAVPRRDLLASAVDTLVDRATRSVFTRFDATADALYASTRPRKLDYLAFDYYDPVIGHFAGPARSGFGPHRSRWYAAELWEQNTTADGLAVFLRQAYLQVPDRPILVAENGMATPDANPRPDGVRRDAFLRSMTDEIMRAKGEGIPVAGYVHWTLTDNYEWGSYKPRFGLHGVDRSDGVRILDTDATGVDAAGAYAEVITRWGAS